MNWSFFALLLILNGSAIASTQLLCLRGVLHSSISDSEWLSSQIADIQKVDFPDKFYRSVTERMKDQVHRWVRESASNEKLHAIRSSHQTHLENLESDLMRYRARLEMEGFSVERLQAQIWVHDIGKFIAPDELVAARHVNNADPKMAAFLDHSKTSQQYLLKHPFFESTGKVDNVTRQLYYDIAGHDGPAGTFVENGVELHSWWGDEYPSTRRLHPNQEKYPGRWVGGIYPDAQSPVLQVLDRMDQPALKMHGHEIIGGPNKIARQQRAKLLGQDKLKPFEIEQEAIWESLSSVPEGAYTQYLILEKKFKNIQSLVTHEMLSDLKARVNRVRDLRGRTRFFSSPNQIPGEFVVKRLPGEPAEAIGFVLVKDKRHYFSDIESFYGTQEREGSAAAWAKETGLNSH